MPSQNDEIRALVRAQIADALKRDLDGDEFLMKEVWEACKDAADVITAKAELSRIIDLIERASK